VLIDTGCMQTKVLSERIGTLLRKDGGKVFETDVALTSGVGGVSYEVQGIMTLMVALPLNAPPSHYRHVWLRVLVCRDVTSDLIIGLLSIQFYDLLPLLNTHPATSVCCEICAIRTHNTTRSARRTGTVTLGPTGENNHDDDTVISGRSFPQDGPLPILLPHHHSTYTEPMATMVATDSCGS